MDARDSQKPTHAGSLETTQKRVPTGPPPLPQDEEPWYSNWVVIASSVALLLLPVLFLTPPSIPGAASTQKGSTGGEDAADGPSGSEVEGDESASEESPMPGKGELSETDAQAEKQQGRLLPEESEDHDSPGKEDVEEVQPTEQVQGDEQRSVDTAGKPKSISHFFTLDELPKRKQSQLLRETSTDDLIEQGSGLSGRAKNNKADLLRKFGGTETTEAAVKLGLEWLASNQRNNGLWGLQGPFSQGSNQDNVAAASAMALLAFQGAGHTHQGDPQDPFTSIVRKGWKGLLRYLDENRENLHVGGSHNGYTEALCTIALCELYGMTKDRRYRKPAIEAIEYCLRAQSDQGGWRYQPRQDADTSVTGWFLMALQSARMAKIKVPNDALAGVEQYLNAASTRSGERYAYQPGAAATRAMKAEGLLCRQYLGWKRDDPRLRAGTDYLLQQLPNWDTRNVYYWYYATQVTHHMGGEPWRKWNEVMRVLIPSKQIKSGNERGSWDPQGHPHGSAGGRLYVTCLSLYMLEVYYRHLPIYQDNAVGNVR